MKITDVPFAVLRLQYQLARVPLQLIEERVMGRLDSEAPARLLYERSMGRLDVAVGTVLGAPDVARRGEALIERSDALGRAAVLDEAADRAVDVADSDLRDAVVAAGLVREQAEEDKIDQVNQARTAAAHEKVAAINEAEERVDNAQQRVDESAAQRKQAAEAAKRAKQDRAEAAARSATAVADAKLEDAEDKRAEAAAEMAAADRTEKLADDA
jgi:hypothetical protein